MSFSKTVHPACERIVKHLQKERERQKLSKYALAQRSGISQSMIGRVESGTRIPTLDTILRIADALEIDLGALVKKTATPFHKKSK